MSTRSGRRIHSSFHENTVNAEGDRATKSELKTRRKRLEENEVDFEISIQNSKKRPNYVSYPSEEDATEHVAVPKTKTVKRSRRNTLKEHNATVPTTENFDLVAEVKTVPRYTRQTQKSKNNVQEPIEIHISGPAVREDGKSKKNRKKKAEKSDKGENVPDKSETELMNTEVEQVESKKGNKKNKKNKSHTKKKVKTTVKNSSIVSTDSFHSAAGSPIIDIQVIDTVDAPTIEKTANTDENETKTMNKTFEEAEHDSHKKNRSTRQSFNTTHIQPPKISEYLNSANENNTDTTKELMNTTYEKDSDLNSAVTKTGTPSKSTENFSVKLNGTFDMSPKNSNDTFDKTNTKLNTTFDKTDTKLNTTFDKTDTKLNTTFDKTDSQKSSLVSSDRDTINVTFDKSSNSRISITSDEESKTENIVNMTPVLINSSCDESKTSINEPTHVNQQDTKKPSSKIITSESAPLVREDTFTKDTSVITLSLKRSKISIPTPGSTPFHPSRTRSSQRDRSVLNVTRPLEKPTQGSVEAVNQARQTRVMFCSPVNNPAVEVQQKRKVIKSSMKGSNKSFVFEETEQSRGVPRKRSLTATGSESSSKRPRPDLTRQRSITSAGAAATPRHTPPASAPAPPRTKLPNFAALHQKRFAKMESLAECQQRKARRAKQLLTPITPSKAKSTPTVSAEPSKPAEDTKTPAAPATPARKLPTTLETLRPGFTRFGFKMQTEANPFLTSNKPEIKPQKTKPNSSKTLLPTANRKTVARKETPRDTVMRERERKREQIRTENRTTIKGVRTNRRFELQMKMRYIE